MGGDVGESREERNARLEAELNRIAARIAEIRRILRQDPGEGEGESPEERRRRLRVIGGGGAASVAAFLAVPRAWAHEHARVAAGYLASAAGGAVITAAAVGHPASATHAVPNAPLLSPAAPTAFVRSAAPLVPMTSATRADARRTAPPADVPTRSRTDKPGLTPNPGEVRPQPRSLLPTAIASILPIPIPSALASAVRAASSPSPTCTLLAVSAGGRILICR